MNDQLIEGYLINAGHTPGERMRAETIRAAFHAVVSDCSQVCKEIAERYPVKPGIYSKPTHGDDIIRQSRRVAESCAAAIHERFHC